MVPLQRVIGLMSGGYVEEALFVKTVDDRIYIKARGHVTAILCPELKTTCFTRFEAKPPVVEVNVDLTECDYMDSTFLGLIVGLTKRLNAASKRKITIFGANSSCLGLLKTIGVLGLVETGAEPVDFPAILDQVGRGSAATAEFLLDAHEELSSLSDENRAKFSALTTMLRDSLKETGSKD